MSSSSNGMPFLPTLCGILTPSKLLLFRGTNEASCILFPVCGVCLPSTVLSLMVQLGFPFSVPITKHPEDWQCHSWNPKWLAVGSCLALCGLGLSFLQEWVGSFFLLFFYKWGKSVQCGGTSFVWRSCWFWPYSVASVNGMVYTGCGGEPGGRVKGILP